MADGPTRGFLDYFNLKSLDDLPPLSEVKALIEPVLFQESGEDCDVSHDSETQFEVGTKPENQKEKARLWLQFL